MHVLFTAVLGVIALGWVVEVVILARGVPSLPSVGKFAPAADADCPTISILFAGRDEAEKLPDALATMLVLDYPRYEVIAVDDRSEDGTGAILEKAARGDARLKPVRVDSLPAGWLGKPHALQQAYERSSGEWLVFTDADVHFAPDVLRRAVALVRAKTWDHMTLMCDAKMFSFGERIAMTFFGMAFMIGTRPWEASNTRAAGYSGVGAFQMIRRLAMEVVDDMKLGKLAKEAGVRSGVGKAGSFVSVHWHAGVGNIVRGVTKNFFATTGYKFWVAVAQVASVLALCVLPVAAMPFVHGWARVFAAVATALPIIATAGVARELKTPMLYALTFPVGGLLFAWMLARSTIVTLWRGGIVWRGTFYHLEDLRRGVV